jgi:hypothetical protein
MAQSKQEQLDLDEGDDDEFHRMRDMLYAHISDFAEEHDLPIGALSPLLVELTVLTRMTDYALSVAKPSASGLKLELDRMRRDVDQVVRNCKQNADEFLAHSKDAIREAQEQEAEAGSDGEDRPARKP